MYEQIDVQGLRNMQSVSFSGFLAALVDFRSTLLEPAQSELVHDNRRDHRSADDATFGGSSSLRTHIF